MPKKKTLNIPLIFFILITLISFLGVAVMNFIDTSDYLIANVLEVSGTTVIIGNNCTAIVADTSPERASAIEIIIKGGSEERPNTYDIFAQTLKSFNITLEQVTIDGFEKNVYYANLFLRSGNKVLKLDSKPSDAIALALRTNSTIYLNRTLLQEVGRNIC